MNDHVTTEQEPSVTRLVAGIVTDIQDLLTQQVALLKAEVRADVDKAMEVTLYFVGGACAAGVGVMLLSLMLVHLVHWLFEASLPLWGSFAIVGVLETALGLGLLALGKKKSTSMNLLPEQSLEAMRENVPWRTIPK